MNHKQHKGKPSQDLEFGLSIGIMVITWLALTGILAAFWLSRANGPISAFTVLLLVVFVSAWCFIPVQVVRYFRERKLRKRG